MRLGITGTPATGKTTLARLLSDYFNYPLLDVKELVMKKGWGKEIDLDLLKNALNPLPKKVIIESHLIAEIPLPLDNIIVLHASPYALKKRMKRRNYPKEKIIENIEAELLDYFTIYAEKNYDNIIHIDTTGLTPKQLLKKALHYLKNNRSDMVDYKKELIKYALYNKI